MRIDLRALALGLASLMALGCSDSDDTTGPPPSETEPTADAGAEPKLTLSKAFGANCATCHGPTGEGSGTYPRIPGSKDVDGYISTVRSGRGAMPAFSSAVITDGDLRSDYEWLTTKR